MNEIDIGRMKIMVADCKAVDEVVKGVNSHGYDIELVKKPRYVWFFSRSDVGEDAHILLLKTTMDNDTLLEALWEDYCSLIRQQEDIYFDGLQGPTGFYVLQEEKGVGVAFVTYLQNHHVEAENVEFNYTIIGW